MYGHFVYLEVENYLAQWVIHAFGNPVELPKGSPEHLLLLRFLSKPPETQTGKGNLMVKIPYFREKDPRMYNYLSPRGKKALENSLYALFLNNMWSELADLDNSRCNITDVIYAWLEKHGIDEEYWETIRQKYYRLRKKYLVNNSVKLC